MSFQRGAACWCLIYFAFSCSEGDFLFFHCGVILCPPHLGSEQTLDPFLFTVGSIFVSFFASFYLFIPDLFLLVKVVIIFQTRFIEMLGSAGVKKHARVSSSTNSVHKSRSQSQRLSLAPIHFYWFICLAYLSHYSSGKLLSYAFLLPTRLHVYEERVYFSILVVGPSTCMVLNLWPQIFKKINHRQVKGVGMKEHRRIKNKILSPT